jgi:hypothetical protein
MHSKPSCVDVKSFTPPDLQWRFFLAPFHCPDDARFNRYGKWVHRGGEAVGYSKS